MRLLYIIDPTAPMSVPQALLVAVTGIAVVLLELALLTLVIQLLSKAVRLFTGRKKNQPEEEFFIPPVQSAAPAAKPAGVPLPDGRSEGSLELENVDEPTAAVIMAIVSNESGIPLNRLSFKSIRLMQEKQK